MTFTPEAGASAFVVFLRDCLPTLFERVSRVLATGAGRLAVQPWSRHDVRTAPRPLLGRGDPAGSRLRTALAKGGLRTKRAKELSKTRTRNFPPLLQRQNAQPQARLQKADTKEARANGKKEGGRVQPLRRYSVFSPAQSVGLPPVDVGIAIGGQCRWPARSMVLPLRRGWEPP